MSMSELYAAEALLDDRERMCLAGYMLMKDSDAKAKIKAYVYSRSYQVKDDMGTLSRKVDKWWGSPKVQAFLQLWEKKGEIVNEEARALRQTAPQESPKSQEEMTAIEEIIQRYEVLYKEAEDVDDKAKILKMIVDTRHKNKEEVKEDTRTTRIYLPQRCSECILYRREQEKTL